MPGEGNSTKLGKLKKYFKLLFMAKREFSFYIFCLLLAVFSGCYKDKADTVAAYNPPPPHTDTSSICDTVNITFTGEITNIMTINCFSCHAGTADLGAGIQLDDYSTLKAYSDNGLLLSSITQDGGTSFMPKDAAKLSDCEISKFEAWINRGAPQN